MVDGLLPDIGIVVVLEAISRFNIRKHLGHPWYTVRVQTN